MSPQLATLSDQSKKPKMARASQTGRQKYREGTQKASQKSSGNRKSRTELDISGSLNGAHRPIAAKLASHEPRRTKAKYKRWA